MERPPGVRTCDLLQRLPAPLLRDILHIVEEPDYYQWAPTSSSVEKVPNPLIGLRLVSKTFREAADEVLSYLTCTLHGTGVDETKGQEWASYAMLFSRGLPQWPALTHLVLCPDGAPTDFIEFVLILVGAGCPKLEQLTVLDMSSDAQVDEFPYQYVSLACLTPLKFLRKLELHRVRACGLGWNQQLVTSLGELEIYGGFLDWPVRTPPALQHLVLDLTTLEPPVSSTGPLRLDLKLSTSLKSMQVTQCTLVEVQFAASLTAVNLTSVTISDGTLGPVLLPLLVELKLVYVTLQGSSLAFELPADLGSLSLCRNDGDHVLPLLGSPIDILSGLKKLTKVKLWGIDDLLELPSFDGCALLSALELLDLEGLTSIQRIGPLDSLQYLSIDRCTNLQLLPSFEGLPNLESLRLGHLYALEELPELRSLTALEWLQISKLVYMPSLESLQRLSIFYCEPLDDDHELQLPTLTRLRKVYVLGEARAFTVRGLHPGVTLESWHETCNMCEGSGGASPWSERWSP